MISLINLDSLLMRICEPNLLKEAPDSTLARPHFQITFQHLIATLTKGLKVATRITYPSKSGLAPVIMSSNVTPKMNLYETKQNGKNVVR